MAEGKFKPDKPYRLFTLSFLQKFESEQLLFFFSCMVGLRHFLTKGLTPVTVEGRHVTMWLFKSLQVNVAVDIVQKLRC